MLTPVVLLAMSRTEPSRSVRYHATVPPELIRAKRPSVASVYSRRREARVAAALLLREAFVIAGEPPEPQPVVLGRD